MDNNKKEVNNSNNNNVVHKKEEYENKILSFEELENERITFMKNYKSKTRLQTVVGLCFFALMIGGIYLITTFSNYFWLIFVGIIVLFFVLYQVKKYFQVARTEMTRKYVFLYRNKLHDHVYSATKGVEILEAEAYRSLDKNKLNDLSLFGRMKHVESNDGVKAKFEGREFETGNIAVYREKMMLDFYGKAYLFTTDKEYDGKLYIHIHKPDLNAEYLDLTDMVKVENDKFDVYSSLDENETNKILSQRLVDALSKVSIDELCTEFLLAINGNNITVCAGYNSVIIDIAANEKIDQKVFDRLYQELQLVLSVYKAVK